MKHILIVSHCSLASSYIETAAMIAGKQSLEEVHSFSMREGEDFEEFVEEISKYVAQDVDGEYLVLADLFGASPCNSTCMAMRGKNYRIVTGLNLGMLLEALFSLESLSLDELSEKLMERGKEGIQVVYIPDNSSKR